MTIKQYLNRYWRIKERIRQIEFDIIEISAQIEGKAVKQDGMPRGSGISDPTAQLAAKYADLLADRNKALQDALEKRDEIERVIDAVENRIYSRLLYDRYILLMKWDDIAFDISYEATYTRTRLHSRALQAAEKIAKKHQNTSTHVC